MNEHFLAIFVKLGKYFFFFIQERKKPLLVINKTMNIKWEYQIFFFLMRLNVKCCNVFWHSLVTDKKLKKYFMLNVSK